MDRANLNVNIPKPSDDFSQNWLFKIAAETACHDLEVHIVRGEPGTGAKTHRITFGIPMLAKQAEIEFILHRRVKEVAEGFAMVVRKACSAKSFRVVIFTGRAQLQTVAKPLKKHEATIEASFSYLIQTPGIAEPPKRKPRAKKKDLA